MQALIIELLKNYDLSHKHVPLYTFPANINLRKVRKLEAISRLTSDR